MWSAVCSRSSTAGRHPGAKMTPGGGIPTSEALYRRGKLHGHAADNTNEETAMTMASARAPPEPDPRRGHPC